MTEHSDSYREGSSPSQWSTGPSAALASELPEEEDTEEVQLVVLLVAELWTGSALLLLVSSV